MKRIIATMVGLALAAGLAVAAPTNTAEGLAVRYFAATDDKGMAANWQDWHPEAVHSITVKYGLLQKDDHMTYAIADWETLPDWEADPAIVDAMQGYTEISATAPEYVEKPTKDGSVITAMTQVDYTWDGYTGQMKQTDRFVIISLLGKLVIQSLDTTFDYR